MSHSLSLFQAISYCLGDIVGSGIFVSATAVLNNCESCWLSLVVWIASAVLSFFGSLVYIEFATTVKKSGGDFAYLTFVGWRAVATAFYFVGSLLTYPSILAIQTLAIGYYLVDGLSGFVAIHDSDLAVLRRLCGFAVLLPIMFLNLFSLRKVVGQFQLVATSLKAAIVAAVIVAGVIHWVNHGRSTSLDQAFVTDKTTPGGVVLAIFAGLYSYNGWALLTVGVEEVHDPKRTLPIATFAGLFLATVVYVGMNVMYFTTLTVEEFKSTDTVAVLFMKQTINEEMAKVVPFLIALVLLGSLNATLFGSSRYLMVGSRAGLMPSLFSGLHRSSESPRAAVIAQVVLSLGLSFLGNLEELINYVSYAISLQQVAVILALLYMRCKRLQDTADGGILKAPLAVVSSYLVVSVALVVVPLLPSSGNYLFAVYAAGLLFVGIVAYLLLIRPRRVPSFIRLIDGYLLIGSQVLLDTMPPLIHPQLSK